MASIILNKRLRDELEAFVLHAPSARECCRALAVLWLADGETINEVAELLRVSRQTVHNWLQRFQERDGLDLHARLADAPRQGRPPSALGIIDPLIAAVIDKDPRKFGYHFTVWTAPLLREYLQQVHGIAVSQKSVRLAIDRLRMSWKRPRHQLSLRPEYWRQSKGG
jgi:transposase